MDVSLRWYHRLDIGVQYFDLCVRFVTPDRGFDTGARDTDIPEFAIGHRAQRGTRLLTDLNVMPAAPDQPPDASQRSADRPASLRMGSLDDDPGIRPMYHAFVGSKAPWNELPEDGLPRYEAAAPNR